MERNFRSGVYGGACARTHVECLIVMRIASRFVAPRVLMDYCVANCGQEIDL